MKLADHVHVRPSATLRSVLAAKDHPLNVFERVCIAENYEFERTHSDEIHISLPCLCSQHDISLIWNPADEHLALYLVFEGRVSMGRSDEFFRLIALINERLSGGHFDFWQKNGMPVYRNSVSLRGGAKLNIEQAMDMIALTLDAVERGYPAFQYVIWGGKTPEDALTLALVDLAQKV